MVPDRGRQRDFSTQFCEFFVNPEKGSDGADGSRSNPFKTITHALQKIPPTVAAVIHLEAGTYSTSTGEVFPLILPPQTSFLGEASNRGSYILLCGGGEFDSSTFGRQNATLLLGEGTHLRGLTLTNPHPGGTGIWLESVSATVVSCQVVNCGREGIFVTGTANPSVIDTILRDNAASGISFVREARGEVQRSIHQRNRFGIVISDRAAPMIGSSQFLENRSGLVLSGAACPVIRNCVIKRNTEYGLALFNHALPDLGQRQEPALNYFEDNGIVDLLNAASLPLRVVGNQLNPTRVQGRVDFQGSELAQTDSAVAAETRSEDRSRRRNWESALQRSAFAGPTKRVKTKPRKTKLFPVATPTLSLPLRFLPFLWAGHWAEAFLHALQAQHIFDPSTADRPPDPEALITQTEYAVWISKAFNLPPSRFNRSIQLQVPLTRLHAVVTLVKELGLTGGDPEVLTLYRDRAQIPSSANDAVASATQKHLIASYPEPGCFNPMQPITMAEAAVMLYQGWVAQGKARPIPSPYIVRPHPAIAYFSDIQDHWAADFIQGLASQSSQQTSNTGEFNPNHPILRADYASWLADLFHPAADRPVKPFTDVADDFWASRAIHQVYQGKLMGGFADGTFRPEQSVTRLQVLLSLVNVLRVPAADLELLQRYEDAHEIPEVAQQAIATATAQWLVVNYPRLTQLHPHLPATRAEAAASLYQALVRLGRAVALPSPYIVHPNYPKQHQQLRPTPIVVLDPGHGGFDSGVTISSPGPSPLTPPMAANFPEQQGLPSPPPPGVRTSIIREKDIVLAIAQAVAPILQQNGIHVVLTRSTDQTLDLAHRVQQAEQVDADIFVSLHANAMLDRQSNLDPSEVNGVEIHHSPYSKASAHLAQTVHHVITRSINVTDRGVRQTNFYVLRSVSMPAISIELGYLTGSEDRANLINSDYQEQIAGAIAQGILQFVQQLVE